MTSEQALQTAKEQMKILIAELVKSSGFFIT